MGLSASQARLLALQAKQSNLEYQGQQINNERTILSQQTTALYNSLLAMTVPTPPSTSDYTTIEYSGTYNAASFTIGDIIPTGTTYTVDLQYSKTGGVVQTIGTMNVTNVSEKIYVEAVKDPSESITPSYEATDSPASGSYVMSATTASAAEDGVTYYTYDESSGYFTKVDDVSTLDSTATIYYANGAYDSDAAYEDTDKFANTVSAGTTYNTDGFDYDTLIASYYILNSDGKSVTAITASNIEDYFTLNTDGTYTAKSGITVVQKTSSTSGTEFPNPDYGNVDYYVGGNACYDLAADGAGILGESYSSYIDALRRTFSDLSSTYTNDSDFAALFYFYTTQSESSSSLVPHFVLKTAAASAAVSSGYVDSYDYVANGTYTSSVSTTDCTLEFDSSGRITAIGIPVYDDDGNITSYTTVTLTATEVTDEDAYDDAYAEYEYENYLYDKQNAEINAKTEIVQQEDKKLELELQELDNERTEITTEIEAIEKVIEDNIESSYKTFSG